MSQLRGQTFAGLPAQPHAQRQHHLGARTPLTSFRHRGQLTSSPNPKPVTEVIAYNALVTRLIEALVLAISLRVVQLLVRQNVATSTRVGTKGQTIGLSDIAKDFGSYSLGDGRAICFESNALLSGIGSSCRSRFDSMANPPA